MSIFQRLFGGGGAGGRADEQMADLIASMILMSDALLSLQSHMSNPQQKRVIIGFYYGFVDFMGQAKGLSEDARLATARSAFRQAFSMSGTEAEVAVAIAIESSQTPEGRRYMMEGSQALRKFMAKQSPTPGNMRLMQLLAGAD